MYIYIYTPWYCNVYSHILIIWLPYPRSPRASAPQVVVSQTAPGEERLGDTFFSKPWNGEKRRETPRNTQISPEKTWSLVFGEGKRDIEWGQGTMFGWLDCLFIGNLIITTMTIIWPSYDHICEHHGPWIMGVSDVFWPDTGSSPDSKKPPWANHNEVPKASSVRLWVVEPLEKEMWSWERLGPSAGSAKTSQSDGWSHLMIVDKSEVIVDISKTQLDSLDSWEIQSAESVPWGIVLGDGMQHDAHLSKLPGQDHSKIPTGSGPADTMGQCSSMFFLEGLLFRATNWVKLFVKTRTFFFKYI